MTSIKTLTRYGVRGVIEASYGAGGTPGATDGLLPMEANEVDLEYLHDGQRGANPVGGQMTRAEQSGLGAAYDLATHCYTPGIAYSATELPSVDRMLRAAGFQRIDDFVAPTSVIYDPETTPGGLESLFLEVFMRAQQYNIKGAYCDLTIAVDGPGIPLWTFSFQHGIGVLPTDVVVPAITYPHVDDQKPQKATSIALALGAFTGGVVRGFEFALNREIGPRADDNSGGHKGATPGNRDPQITVRIEAATLGALGATTIDPYTLKDAGTEFAFSLQVGSVASKQWKISMPHGQILDVNEAEDGASAIWELLIGGGNNVGSQDDVQFVFTGV